MTKVCKNCSKENPEKNKFCSECGGELVNNQTEEDNSARILFIIGLIMCYLSTAFLLLPILGTETTFLFESFLAYITGLILLIVLKVKHPKYKAKALIISYILVTIINILIIVVIMIFITVAAKLILGVIEGCTKLPG